MPKTLKTLFDDEEGYNRDGRKLSKELGTYFGRLFRRHKKYKTKDVFLVIMHESSLARCFQSLANTCRKGRS